MYKIVFDDKNDEISKIVSITPGSVFKILQKHCIRRSCPIEATLCILEKAQKQNSQLGEKIPHVLMVTVHTNSNVNYICP